MARRIICLEPSESKLSNLNRIDKKPNNKSIFSAVKNTETFGEIQVVYEYDYPIDNLDATVRNMLSNHKRPKDLYQAKRKIISQMNTIHDSSDHNKYKQELSEINKKIKGFESGSFLLDYIAEITPILEEYNKLEVYNDVISFDDEVTIPEDLEDRLLIISQYLQIAQKYVPLKIEHNLNIVITTCINCNYEMGDLFINDQGEQVCPRCEMVRLVRSSDISNNIKTKNSRAYDVLVTFRRDLNHLQGLESVYVDPIIYKKLDEYAINCGLAPAKEIENMPLDEYGKRGDTSLALLIEGLKQINYPAFYKNANYIGAKLWGWKLLNLKNYMEQIITDFIDTQKYFEQARGDRSSNICGQYRILQHLRLVGLKVRKEDFKLPKTESLNTSDAIWRIMCQLAGKPYIPIFFQPETIETEGPIIISKSSSQNMNEEEIEELIARRMAELEE